MRTEANSLRALGDSGGALEAQHITTTMTVSKGMPAEMAQYSRGMWCDD